jgi:bacterial/archaeal transporter family-2 protein
MIWLLLLIAFAAGTLMPVQAGVNSELRTVAGHPIVAAILQFSVGMSLLIAILIVTRPALPQWGKLAAAPWWVWTGGLCGAIYIISMILLAPRVGAATLIGVSVTGQLLMSLVLDHYGFVGYPVHPVNAWRIVGAGLLLAGLRLIQRF